MTSSLNLSSLLRKNFEYSPPEYFLLQFCLYAVHQRRGCKMNSRGEGHPNQYVYLQYARHHMQEMDSQILDDGLPVYNKK